jgi:DNA-binding transcriptional regulator of glucitol operon
VTYGDLVLRRYRFALRPGWILLHLVTVALIVTMVLLGRWQLSVSERKHFNLQNFGYALQWWAFTLFVGGMWVRVLRDALRRPSEPDAGAAAQPESAASQPAEPATVAEPPVAYRRYVMPQSADGPATAGDSEQAAYNDYLAKLAEEAAAKSGGEGTAR